MFDLYTAYLSWSQDYFSGHQARGKGSSLAPFSILSSTESEMPCHADATFSTCFRQDSPEKQNQWDDIYI